MKWSTQVLVGEYAFTISGEVTEAESMMPDGFFEALTESMRDSGVIPSQSISIQPKSLGVGASGPANSNGGGYSPRGGAPAPANRPAPAASSNWECPVHGTEAVGEGYGGKGIECKVWTLDPGNDDPNGEWVRLDEQRNYRGSTMRDGSIRYWCRHKANTGGGRRY